MSKLPISVCIIAKNEEKYIENCLKYLQPLGMEIVVVDTGSTDKTKEIASKYTSHVYDFEWVDDFSAARNFAAEKASNKWILSIDCDEYMTKFNKKNMKLYLQQFPKSVGVLELATVKTVDGQQQTQAVEELPRLYNKTYFHYCYRIHEQITPYKTEGKVTIYSFKMPAYVEHHGYDITESEIADKQKRNLKLLEKSLGENSGHDDYLYYQIGQSNTIIGDFKTAREAYKKCFECNTDKDKTFVGEALQSYAYTLLKQGDNMTVIKLYNDYKDVLTTSKQFFNLATAYEKCDMEKESIMIYKNLVKMPDAELLGDEIYNVFIKILTYCDKIHDYETQNMYAQELIKYGKAHGKEITFG